MKSLYLRIVITTICVMILSSVLAFLISNAYYQYRLKPYNDKKITGMAVSLQALVEDESARKLRKELKHISDLGYQIHLVHASGKTENFGSSFDDHRLSGKTVDQVLSGGIYHGIKKFPTSLFITGFFDNKLSNTIGVPVTAGGETMAMFIRPDIELQFGEMRLFFAMILLFTITLSILLVLISTRYIVRPIIRLTKATKRIAGGDYNIDLRLRRKDEIGSLAASFTEMSQSLSQLEAMRQQFVSNVSHEIQTPLASIRGFSERLQRSGLTEEEKDHYSKVIETEAERLSQLSRQLLLLASLDNEESILEKRTFDAGEQIRETVRMLQWSWQEKGLAIVMDLPECQIDGDPRLLQQVWINLLNNAIKFTPEGGTITLSLIKRAATCEVSVKDTGRGISEEDLPHVFSRFYQADESRQNNGSSGLGLSIVKKIVKLHAGDIDLSSAPGEGAVFTVSLPLL